MVDVVVIGGGAAGLMAAGQAACYGKTTILLEKNPRLAHKLSITGKGRCNITNNSDVINLINNVPTNGRFLYSAFSQFSAQDTINFFENLELKLKTERGNRVFPESDKAIDVVKALIKFITQHGVKQIKGRANKILTKNGSVCGVLYNNNQKIDCRSVIISTGGMSYSKTGSTGDGYILAKQAGHNIIPANPSLVPLVIKQDVCKDMQGLSLKNVVLTIINKTDNKVIFSQMGEMLFTHFGVSGPLVLTASAHMRGENKTIYKIKIDLKPALSKQQLDARILREFSANPNKNFSNCLASLLPAKMINPVSNISEIPLDIKINKITKDMREKLIEVIKEFCLDVEGFRPLEEAIITAGGVDTKQINPKTMESKLVKGLFFAGEVIDTDAYTGGYNLQIAWSTGYLAGIYGSS